MNRICIIVIGLFLISVSVIADGEYGIEIFDLSNSSRPELTVHYATRGTAEAAF